MKSRVKKYSDLHEKIASDAESTVENSDLSHFANRLNEIDDQFERVHTSKEQKKAVRARQNEINHQEDTSDSDSDSLDDTFDSDYLENFLDEVKQYNVKKGYRDLRDTQANILEGLDSHINLQDTDSELNINSDQKEKIYDREKLGKLADELISDDFNDSFSEETLIFGQDALNLDDNESDSDETYDGETISMALEDMDFTDEEYDEEEYQIEDEENDFKETNEENINQDLLEQTQTLQHKVVDLENNLNDMNSETTKTNRLLHVVLSLLLFAIIVVVLLIVAQFV